MRRLLKFVMGFVALGVVAAGAAVILIPRERIVQLAADHVRQATGRELTLSGDLSPSFWPVLGVRTGPVTLSNAPWGEAEHLVSAGAAEIGVELMPLFSHQIKVTKLRLVDPVVSLEVNEEGRGNWVFDGPSGGSPGAGTTAGAGGALPRISLPEAVITNGTVRFTDHGTGQHIDLTALDLTAGLASLDAPLTLSGSGIWNGSKARLDALIDTPAAVMDGRRAPVMLALAGDPANISFDGEVQIDPSRPMPLIDGALVLDIPDASAAAAWAGGTRPPAGLADIGAVTLKGDVAATADSLRLAGSGRVGYRGRAVGFDLEANGGPGWAESLVFTVAASGRSEGLFQAAFNGPVSLGNRVSAKGPLDLRISDLRGLAEWAGGTRLNAPAGTFQSASVESGFAMAGDRIDLSGLVMTIDRTRVTGNAAVETGGRPFVTANLNSGPLDLSPFMGAAGGSGGGGGGGGAGQGWSTEPLDLSALRAVDADVAIRAEAVDLGDIEIGRSDIRGRLREGRLDMRVDRVDAYGGGMTGDIALVAGDTAQVTTDLTISQVQLRPLLNALAGFDSLEGIGDFRIDVQGRGRSMDALMHSLRGSGGIDLADGAILGVNLAAMVRNLTGQAGAVQKTDFSAVTGTFDITDGVLHNTDFSFLGPLIRVVGAGTVDLGGRSQNFRLEPTAVASLTGQGGAIGATGLGVFPVLITGTWANPKIRPDLTAAIEGFLQDPSRTIDAVTGLVKDADPGKAAETLLGTLGGGSGQETGGALGQLLSKTLGNESGSATGTGTGTDTGTGTGERQSGTDQVLGTLLGTLGGGQGGTQEGTQEGTQGNNQGGAQAQDGTVAQPTYGDGTATDQGASATDQGGLGALLGALGGGRQAAPEPQSAPQPGYGSGTDQAAPGAETGGGALAPVSAPYPRPAPRTAALDLPRTGDDGTVPAQQYGLTPTPETAREAEPEPEPLTPEKALEDLLRPAPDQTGATGETATEAQGATEGETQSETQGQTQGQTGGSEKKKRLKVEDFLKILQ